MALGITADAPEQIRPSVQFLGTDLLGRHISYGTERRAGTGKVSLHVDGCGVCVRTVSLSHRKLRQAKIQNPGVSTLRDRDVGRFDVAMDDARSMSGIESVGNVNGDGEKNFHFQRTPGDAVLQC